MIGVTGANGVLEPWRWWGTDQRAATVALHRRKASLRIAHLNTANADVAQYVFTPLYETARRHYAQRREGGQRLGTLGPSAKGHSSADAVIARWLHNAGSYAVQLFDAYGHELADCIIYPVGSEWQVRVRYLYDEHVTEAQSTKLLDGVMYSALAAGVKYGEAVPLARVATNLGAVADEALAFGMANLAIAPEEASANLNAVMKVFQGERRSAETGIVAIAQENEGKSFTVRPPEEGGSLSDLWSLVRPSDSLNTQFVGTRDFRRLKTSGESDPVPTLGKRVDAAWLKSPEGMTMECVHMQSGDAIGAIFPLVGDPDVRKGVAVTRLVVSEYPTASMDKWKPSIFRVWAYRINYNKPIGTMLVVPHVNFYYNAPEPNTAWIPSEFLRGVFDYKSTEDYAVDNVDADVHIVGRLKKTPHIDPNLAATIEMAMWQLRYRSEGAIVKLVSFSAQ